MPEAATHILPAWVYATLPLWPLAGAVLVGVLLMLRVRADRAHWPVVLGVAVSAALGVLCFLDLRTLPSVDQPPSAVGRVDSPPGAAVPHAAVPHQAGPQRVEQPPSAVGSAALPGFTYTVYRWISLGATASLHNSQWLAVNDYFDGLTGIMLLFFTVVSLMVVIYAVGYMRDHHGHPERGYERFFAFLGLFVFSMAMLVLAGNFVLLYLGWELVGLCSYLLIGFYYQKPEAAAAAKKAFIVNRVGDFGFALGIFAILWFVRGHVQPGENPLDYAVVFKYAPLMAAADSGVLGLSQATLVALLLTCGAVGKSAQFPLHVWLPDAMEGPTPVSALIHAATMVTAGIYMIARCTPIFVLSEFALNVVLVLGLIGAILTATIAVTQYDMKRILAYSTISQLAFMFVGLGCGVPDSAVFHVFTHAWFKALLFLGAGSVMHAMGGVIDLRRFGGLRHVLPKTRAVMLVGCLALAGFPLLAGFWSKDELVHAAFKRSLAVGVLLLLTAGLTAYYTFRMFFLCFGGRLRLPAEAGEHPHESPPVMLRPLYVLAAGAMFAGYVGVHLGGGGFLGFLAPHGYFHDYIARSTLGHVEHGHGGLWIMYASAVVALGGIGLAWVRYGAAPVEDPDRRALGALWNVWHRKYWVDELYDAALVRPLRGLGHFFYGVDRYGVDGVLWLIAAVPRGLSLGLSFLQRGALQGYALSMVVGLAVILLVWMCIW